MNPWRDLKGLPKEMWLLSLTVLVNRAGAMVIPFLMIYLTKALGISPQKASLVLIAYGFGGMITAPIAGRVSDIVGNDKVMKASLIFAGIVLFFIPLTTNFFLIIILVTSWSIISQAFRPACMAIISDLVPNNLLKPAFSLNRLVINLGMSIGPAIGGFLVYFSYKLIFIVDGASSLIAGILLLFSLKQPAKSVFVKSELQNNKSTILVENGLTAIKNSYFIYFLIALIPASIVFFQLESTVSLFLVRDLKLSETTYGFLFSLNTLIIVFIEVPLNSFTNKWKYNNSLALGCLLTGLGFGVMCFVSGTISASISVIIWTFGEMILFPASSAYVSELSPPTRKGEYMGLYSMSFGVGSIVAPIFGTNILEIFGANTLWLISLVFGTISAIMMWKIKAIEK